MPLVRTGGWTDRRGRCRRLWSRRDRLLRAKNHTSWYYREMSFFRSVLLVCPAACLLAQTPPSATPAQPAGGVGGARPPAMASPVLPPGATSSPIPAPAPPSPDTARIQVSEHN